VAGSDPPPSGVAETISVPTDRAGTHSHAEFPLLIALGVIVLAALPGFLGAVVNVAR
jgi:hypothetical protein